jgi:hypothetical protein
MSCLTEVRPAPFSSPLRKLTFSLCFARTAGLQEYITLIAQQPGGGLRDKPGKPADAYHTCYNLAGASSAQSRMKFSKKTQRRLAEKFVSPFGGARIAEEGEEEVVIIRGEGETEEQASERMKEVWSRTLAWEVSGEQVIYGDKEENELVRLSSLSLPSKVRLTSRRFRRTRCQTTQSSTSARRR